MKNLIEQVRSGKRAVIFIERRLRHIETEMIRDLALENHIRVFSEDNLDELSLLRNTAVHRYGFLPDWVTSRLKRRKSPVVPGDLVVEIH